MRRIKILKIFVIFLLFLVFLIYSNFSLISSFFMATLNFNIAILTVFLIGLLVVYQSAIRLTMLAGTFGILAYKKGKDLEFYLQGITELMPATIAHMFNRRAQKGVLYFTENEAKDVTIWLSDQFFNQKSYTSFFVGTSLMLGLFGTFTGLLVAIDEMGSIILSLGGDDIDIAEIMTGFSGPLGGMAIGFASSLFGVASAIILNVMQYILTRNQAAFLEDVEDWLKGKIIESQSSDVLEEIGTAFSKEGKVISQAPTQGASGGLPSGFIDIFIDTMGSFTEKLEKSNKSSQELYEIITSNLSENTKASEHESLILESVDNSLKELNVNQFSNAGMMEDSLQEISNVILAEHKTIKKSLALQEENNKLLVQLVESLNKKIETLEEKVK
ncbi:hypothetical protein [Malaciobacter marinus]|uniref:MotA/TolQ/ExbB proton channel domain-containing protein n=1 Tax=Malaciobacter marinus TaxID=505249 RepID=A0AB37A159_9BACT|nr:hypothetical protein [Malaciobacter marinus]PPK62932.1 hypothetical protein B0F89_101131 [Malaciobacter marinus]SKB37931.1 hypothetical protein SAMN06295997_10846 [Malaciobacter marinus]